MLKCVPLQQKPPSDMESTLSTDYTTQRERVWRRITAPEFVVRSFLSPLSILWFLLFSSTKYFSALPKPSLLPSRPRSNHVNSDLHSNSNFIPGIKKTNFTTLIDPLKMPHLFPPQITSHNPNQLNPSADCSHSAGGPTPMFGINTSTLGLPVGLLG